MVSQTVAPLPDSPSLRHDQYYTTFFIHYHTRMIRRLGIPTAQNHGRGGLLRRRANAASERNRDRPDVGFIAPSIRMSGTATGAVAQTCPRWMSRTREPRLVARIAVMATSVATLKTAQRGRDLPSGGSRQTASSPLEQWWRVGVLELRPRHRQLDEPRSTSWSLSILISMRWCHAVAASKAHVPRHPVSWGGPPLSTSSTDASGGNVLSGFTTGMLAPHAPRRRTPSPGSCHDRRQQRQVETRQQTAGLLVLPCRSRARWQRWNEEVPASRTGS